MVSVYFVDTPRFRCLDPDDDTLIAKASRVLARVHPESAGTIELAHVIRWPVGIAQFGPGRLAALTALRARLEAAPPSIDLAGDWLDGVASESALRTGEQAAARVARRLAGNVASRVAPPLAEPRERDERSRRCVYPLGR
jgi:protoporphyrinogen oxidase